jgi:hypothetical protein
LADYLNTVNNIAAYQGATGSRFVWRGAANAGWALHSSLFRVAEQKMGTPSTEAELRRLEDEVMEEARSWSLDWHAAGGRLTGLELLSALQHYGVPTRMIDFTFNPFIALWFAVEKYDTEDGRVFAIDISDRMVSRALASRADPWWSALPLDVTAEWSTRPWVWRPPPLDPRIVRQEGCFVLGGVPSTQPARNVRSLGGWRLLRAAEVRATMSLPFGLITYDQAVAAAAGTTLRGRPPQLRAFTVRTENKPALRQELEQAFGYSHRSLFPDFSGLAMHGRSFR